MRYELVVLAWKQKNLPYNKAHMELSTNTEQTIKALRKEGYTQFVILQQVGYEYTSLTGSVIKGG